MWGAFTYLPYWIVAIAWQAALLSATVAVAIPFLRHGTIGLALSGLLVPLLFAVSAGATFRRSWW